MNPCDRHVVLPCVHASERSLVRGPNGVEGFWFDDFSLGVPVKDLGHRLLCVDVMVSNQSEILFLL